MRIPVSVKVLLVFSTLGAAALGLGLFLYSGLLELEKAAAQVDALQGFQIQTKELERFNRSRALRESAVDSEAFEAQLRRVQGLAQQLQRMELDLPAGAKGRIETLSQHLDYVRGAFQELVQRASLDRELRQRSRELRESIEAGLGRLPPRVQAQVRPPLSRMEALSAMVVLDHRPEAIPEIKSALARAERDLTDAHLLAQARELLAAAEKSYLNHLGLEDRERFLNGATQRFFDIGREAIQAISARSDTRRRQLKVAMTAAVPVFCLLILGLWYVSNRYVRTFLDRIGGAIQAIRSGNYDYPLPPVPDDETGDLVVFTRELAGSLERSIRKATESEERYRSLVEGISDWVWELDASGVFTYSSPAARQVLGLEPEEIVGRRFPELLPPEEAVRVAPLLSQALERKEASPGVEMLVNRGDGGSVILESNWQPIPSRDGGFLGLRGVSRDISDRKRAEAEQARLRAQLLHAQKMEAIGTLAGGVAHDFNNLLQSVSGQAEMLLRGRPEGDPDVRKLKLIEKAAQRGAELTRQLLVFGRKVDSRLVPVDLNQEILQVRDLLERTIPKMISIQTQLSSGLWGVRADPAQLEQMLVNLALNAKDAMPQGGVLEFRADNRTVEPGRNEGDGHIPPGRYVRLRVSDTGAGMTPETMEHIFEPFFTTKEVGRGTGLGLSIVYGIVRIHNAHIHCSSEPGGGTSFSVYFPAVEPEATVIQNPPSREAPVPGGSESVLLVDDEEALVELGAEILRAGGYRVLTARTGEEALSLLGDDPGVRLAIVDLNMPGMGGREFLNRVRISDPGLRTLVVTGYQDHGGLTTEDSVLLKPFRAADLLRAVRRALDAAPSAVS